MTPGSLTLPEALDALRRDELVIHPTENVYGVGGRLSPAAIGQLRELKARTEGGFVVLVPSRSWLEGLLFGVGRALADAFWPGPLTLVLDDSAGLFPPGVKAPDGSVAVRVCGNALTRSLVETAGEPLSSSSANAPGDVPARTFDEAVRAVEGLGRPLPGLDGGPLPGGRPSTLVDVRGGDILVLRSGAVAREAVMSAAGAGSGR